MSTSSMPTFKPSHGPEIPVLGYGLGTARTKKQTAKAGEAVTATECTKQAISVGFHHLDGAEMYGNEEELGTAIIESGVPRSSIYLTTKLLPNISTPTQALKDSLKKLKTDHVDLYLIHAPYFDEKEKGITIEQVWKEMEQLHKDGLAKCIGLSNFRAEHIERILKVATVTPAINQIEFNPYLQSTGLLEFHRKHNILTEAYHPLGPITSSPGGPLDPLLEKLGKKYNKNPMQILLRWTIDMGVVAVTTSAKESRLKESLEVVNFKLDREDVEEISKVGKEKYYRSFWGPEYKEADKEEYKL